MYGRRVHEAVIKNNEKTTGVTIHVVNEDYDSGPILGQREIAVLASDSVETLEARVKLEEKNYITEFLSHWIGKKF